MSSESQNSGRQLAAEQAADWLLALKTADRSERAAFVKWLKQSPTHVEEFLMTSATLNEFRGGGVGSAEDAAKLIADAMAQESGGAQIIPLNSANSRLEPRTKAARGLSARQPRVAVAAAIVLALATALGIARLATRNTYSTAVGEQRTVALVDGSVVYLNADSAITVRYSRAARDIVLDSGEAIFEVQHDPVHPFRVHVGDSVIQALGTRFDVYRKAAATTVSVLEGQVGVYKTGRTAIAPPSSAPSPSSMPRTSVAAGQQVDIAAAGEIVRRTPAEITDAVAWRERRLVFRAERLEEIAAEFRRYSPQQIELLDDTARNKRITGTFDADDPASLIMFLEKLDDLSIRRAENRAVQIAGR